MRIITTTSGSEIALDGDLLAIMEALYKEVTGRRELEHSFEDMAREIHHLIEQMTPDERTTYLTESVFLNTVKYENDKLEAYLKKLPLKVAAKKAAPKKALKKKPAPKKAVAKKAAPRKKLRRKK